MKRYTFCIIAAAALLSLWIPATSMAQSPLQLSVLNPIQLVSEYDSVRGVSLGLVYTVNNDMTGFNLSLVANKLYGDMRGIQFGLFNMVEGGVTGWQVGGYNSVAGDFLGWQGAAVNFNSGMTRGLQTGLLNRTGGLRGLQLGLLNMTDTLYGIQIGLLNMNSSGEPFGFLPIINFGF